jgi:hypothetical protein
MKITKQHEGKRIARHWWTDGEWFRVQHFGNNIVVVKDQDRKEIVFERDDMDTDWRVLADEKFDMPLMEGSQNGN